MNSLNRDRELEERFDELFGVGGAYNNENLWEVDKSIKDFIHTLLEEAKAEERKRCLEESYKLARLNLTEDISHAKFIDDGRKMWSVKGIKNRGIEPCYECGNRDKIIKYLRTIDQAISAITNKK